MNKYIKISKFMKWTLVKFFNIFYYIFYYYVDYEMFVEYICSLIIYIVIMD